MDKGLQALVAGIKLGKCAVSTGFVPLALPTVQLYTVQSSRVKFCEASTGFVPILQSRVLEVGGLWDAGRDPSDFFLSKGMVVIYSHCKSSCKELSTQIGFLQPKTAYF